MRDIEEAAAQGNTDAQLALDMFASEVRRHLGGLLVELGGADAIVFTGGIGEKGSDFRQQVCQGLSELGIEMDDDANRRVTGEASIHQSTSRVQLWVVPTNEEIIVARQTKEALTQA